MPSRFLCTRATGLDAVHRTGAGDKHTVYWDRDTARITWGCEMSGCRGCLFRVG